MRWHDFIFSEKVNNRIKRHVIFWLLWWAYFTATYYYYVQVGLKEISFGNFSSMLLLKTSILVFTHIISCYFFIYALLPFYLLKKKYISFTIGLCLLTGFLLVVGYVIHEYLFPYLDVEYHSNLALAKNTIWWTSINSVLLNAPKIIAAAAAIKLVKRWYLKQKEKEKAEREKLVTDLQLLKAQVRPGFLFNSLDHIYDFARQRSPRAQDLLLRFSDLLSYLLYECDDVNVPLERELQMMKEYMQMATIRHGEKIEMEIIVRGSTAKKTIAPLMLLPFIENSFRHCKNQSEQSWINLEISIEQNILIMKLMNGADTTYGGAIAEEDEIKNIKTRLQLLYPQKHELKMYTEQEICMTFLRIDLNRRQDLQKIISQMNFDNYKSLYSYAVN